MPLYAMGCGTGNYVRQGVGDCRFCIFVKKVLTTGRKGDILNKLLRQDAAAGRMTGTL